MALPTCPLGIKHARQIARYFFRPCRIAKVIARPRPIIASSSDKTFLLSLRACRIPVLLLPSRSALSEDERAELVLRAGLPGRRRPDRARIILARGGAVRHGRCPGTKGGGQVGVEAAASVRRGALTGPGDAAPIGHPKAGPALEETERAQSAGGPGGRRPPSISRCAKDPVLLRGRRSRKTPPLNSPVTAG